MDTSKLVLVVGATIPILLAACSGANGERAPNTESPNAGGIALVEEDVLRSPAELTTLMNQVRRQIVYKTKRIPKAEYEQLVRPSLVDQLRVAGFAEDDVDTILSDVDYSRRLQGKR